jgi:predicted Na+-dependent transporter
VNTHLPWQKRHQKVLQALQKLQKAVYGDGIRSAISSVTVVLWGGAHVMQSGGYKIVSTFNICTIFVISGLTLKTDEALKALKHPFGLVYGLVAILIITPMMGFAVRRIPFSEADFAKGLAIFCTVPTTLSSGIAMVSTVCSGTSP